LANKSNFITMISDAVSSERISRIVGYKLTKGFFQTTSPNLPQRLAIIGEANNANQATLSTDKRQITSAREAGELYGYGSPIHMMARILFPKSGDGIGGIPVYVYPQAEPDGAAAKVIEITPSGTATGNGTHYLKIAGRDGIDGDFYAINIVEGDTVADITAKINDAVSNVLGCPMTSTEDSYTVELTSKWRGLTANDLTVTVDTGDNELGITYAINSTQSGSGTPSISGALSQFGNEWNTAVINSYGTNTTIMSALEAFNGRPADGNNPPTGRFVGTTMKPFVAITGSTADNPSAITDSRADDVTIALAPAPNSAGLHFEAAANMALLSCVVAQNNPHLDVAGQSYPDMPTPTSIGSMADYNNRDTFVKKGCSTVDLVAGRYKIMDFVTTYHKQGENPPQFRYVRNLYYVDLNVYYSYYLAEQINVVDKAIANDNDPVRVGNVVKPKQWKAIIFTLADDLSKRALIVDQSFLTSSLRVAISTTNPDRFETFFRYKRSGFARVLSTTAEAGFNFGNL
jgi:phage tail sheath gpL-like